MDYPEGYWDGHMDQETVPFEDLESDRDELDTFQLGSNSQFDGLEDAIDLARKEASTKYYEDEGPSINRSYAVTMTSLRQAKSLIESIEKVVDANYRIRANL